MRRPHYGIDAPGLVRGFLAVALVAGLGAAGCAVLARSHPLARWFGIALLLPAAYAAFMFGYMLWGSLVAKVRDRERVLELVPWTGAEQVLDVGCGTGLLLIGAARRLTSGQAVGIDLWLTRDQSGNSPDAATRNARLEGVEDRVTVQTADMRALPFPDASFDVVLSAWAVHNLEQAADRQKALAEMLRVLRPGGRVVLHDIALHGEYAAAFRAAGVTELRVSFGSPLADGFRRAVSFGSFRPGTVSGRRPAAKLI